MQITEEIAELVGMHTGDGTLYRTNSGSIVWELRGALDEKDYYDFHVVSLLRKIFEKDFLPKFRSGGKNGCYGIQTTNKLLISLFLDFGFLPGNKTHTVKIPNLIFEASDEIKSDFVRGLFDTDGCLRFDKNHTQRHYYPKIEFGVASKQLRDDLVRILDLLGIKGYTWDDKGEHGSYRLCVAGRKRLLTWFSLIGSHNPKHLNKYKKWLKTGMYDAVVAQPGTARDCYI